MWPSTATARRLVLCNAHGAVPVEQKVVQDSRWTSVRAFSLGYRVRFSAVDAMEANAPDFAAPARPERQ